MLKHGNTPVTEVILHTSATPGSWAKGKTAAQAVAEIDRWHKDRGWRGIGYHRVVMPNGEIGKGRPFNKIGAHVKGHNTGSVGICIIPQVTVEKRGRFEDFYTERQRAAVKRIISELGKQADIKKVSGHNQYANKLCPGFTVVSDEWMPKAAPMIPKAPDLWSRILAMFRGQTT